MRVVDGILLDALREDTDKKIKELRIKLKEVEKKELDKTLQGLTKNEYLIQIINGILGLKVQFGADNLSYTAERYLTDEKYLVQAFLGDINDLVDRTESSKIKEDIEELTRELKRRIYTLRNMDKKSLDYEATLHYAEDLLMHRGEVDVD